MFSNMQELPFFFQNQICTNQIRRMDDDNKMNKERLEKSEEREKELKVKVKELERKTSDMESKVRGIS